MLSQMWSVIMKNKDTQRILPGKEEGGGGYVVSSSYVFLAGAMT